MGLPPPVEAERVMDSCEANFRAWSSVVTTTATVGPLPGGASVYVPLARALDENPDAWAMVLIVTVTVMVIAFA